MRGTWPPEDERELQVEVPATSHVHQLCFSLKPPFPLGAKTTDWRTHHRLSRTLKSDNLSHTRYCWSSQPGSTWYGCKAQAWFYSLSVSAAAGSCSSQILTDALDVSDPSPSAAARETRSDTERTENVSITVKTETWLGICTTESGVNSSSTWRRRGIFQKSLRKERQLHSVRTSISAQTVYQVYRLNQWWISEARREHFFEWQFRYHPFNWPTDVLAYEPARVLVQVIAMPRQRNIYTMSVI